MSSQTGDNDAIVPIFDRLYLGGASTLRGFRFRDVGPKDDQGNALGGNTLARLTVEYTIPIIERVRFAVFYDGGFVNPGSWSFSPQKVPTTPPGGSNNGKFSGGYNQDIGIGVRLDLPIGPIRLDYGYPNPGRQLQQQERPVPVQCRISILNETSLRRSDLEFP